MALVLKDRISETTTTSGTGTITLAGARVGFQGFSAIGDGNTTYYCITDGAAWEVGLGTYTSTGNTLARTTVYSNSNGNTSPITLTAGTKNVFSPIPANGVITASGNVVTVPTNNYSYTFPNSSSSLGYLAVPPVGTKTGSYTLAVADIGKYVQIGSGGSVTIPDATFSEGDAISIFNNTASNATITCSITTAYIAGTDSDKATMTLATRGVATVLFISGTVCVVSGNVS